MEGTQNLANVAPRDSAPIAPAREPAAPTASQKRRREETSEDEEEDESIVDDERSTDGEDDGSSLKNFIAEDEESMDEESSVDADVATTEEDIGELQQEAQALLSKPLQCEVIGGRTLRPRATLKPVVDSYWERFGKKEAERLEALERKNEKLVELRMWVKDGLWTLTTALTKRSTQEEVDAEHKRACAALEISSSNDEDEEEDCEDDDESDEQCSDDESEESDEESDSEDDSDEDSDEDSEEDSEGSASEEIAP